MITIVEPGRVTVQEDGRVRVEGFHFDDPSGTVDLLEAYRAACQWAQRQLARDP